MKCKDDKEIRKLDKIEERLQKKAEELLEKINNG